MTFTVAKTTITELNRGLTGLGLDVDKAVNINGFPYTYEDLFSEKPRLVMGDNNAKVGLLLDIFDAMGASTKTGSGDCYYGIKAKAAQQALAQIRQIEDAQGMDPTTWVHLEAIVMDFANKSSSEKEAFRSIFCETFTDKYEQLIRDEMSIEVESTTKNSITWDVDVPDYISGEAKLEIYNTNGVKNSEQIVYGDGLVTTGELDYDTVYYASLSYDGISEIKRATTQVPDIELFYYNGSVYPSNYKTVKLDDAGINEIIESENSGWSPDRPNDYDTELTLYTVGMNGMRKIKISSADTVAKEYLMKKGWSESSVTASNITHDSITWNVSYADGKTLKIYECNKNSDGSMAYNLIDSTMLTAINASYTISGLKELTEYYAVLADEYNREIDTVTAKTQAGQGTGNLTLTDAMRNAGVTITTINGTQYYDYSVPINQMIWNNAQLCIQHRAQYTDEWYIPDSIEFALNMKKLYDSMDWFVDMDGSGAPWDIKLQNRWEEQFPGIPYLGLREQFVLNGQLQHAEGVGNIAFGYWARALGYGPETIYYGAGWAQIGGTKTLDSLLDERLAEGPLYGDNADDHEWVNQGIQWYDSEHPNDPYVVNTNPAKVYSEVEEAVKIAIRMILESMVIL